MKKYLIANWKMNPSTAKEAQKLAAAVVAGIKKFKLRGLEIILCPPFPYISIINHQLSVIKLGAQNCHYKKNGAYTGEVSPPMLKALGCRYVIIGHSERRHYFNEDDTLINKKVKAVLAAGMVPMLAVGERRGESVRVIRRQLIQALQGVGRGDVLRILIAYEPVWAIGTGKAATPLEALAGHAVIQKTLKEVYSSAISAQIPIIYGGSTTHKNVALFISRAQMHGALVGASSLDDDEFIKMVRALQVERSLA